MPGIQTPTHHLTTFLLNPRHPLIDHLAGLLPPVDPAEDPVPPVHEEPAMRDPESQPQPMSVLQAQEVHRRRHESRW